MAVTAKTDPPPMSELANSQGFYLAELPRLFHELRDEYLRWSLNYERPKAEALAHYRRALIGWYEARKDADDPYTGDVLHYVTTVADVYFSGRHQELAAPPDPNRLLQTSVEHRQNPLNHLPTPIRLDETQQLMLRQFHELGRSCRELLLLADYHGLILPRIATALKMEGQIEEVAQQRRKCLLMVRERWQATGILDPVIVPSPADEQIIDRYYDGRLDVAERWEVEARRPTDPVFRRAMELREDWQEVITIAGRQDLMETLEREEARHDAPPVVAPPVVTPVIEPTASPRRPIKLPDFSILLALVLLAGFAYLAWDTFGTAAPDRLYQAYFEPLPNVFDRTPPRDEAERDLNRILYYYDRGDYRTAYDELLPTAQAYPAAPLYLGVSALALDDPARARQWLSQILPGQPYYEFAQWYEALSYLGLGRRPAAVSILEEIALQPDHPYRRRAGELLLDLE